MWNSTKLKRSIYKHLQVSAAKVRAPFLRRKYGASFSTLKAYCMFIGYPRSGHSLVGSLLDAHPNIVIGHELNALKYIQHGCDQETLFALLLDNSRRFTQFGREWTGYSYSVPHQWNGTFRQLEVIGDKKGGESTKLLSSHPDLLERLHTRIHVPLKIIHVIRNPYDNISTISTRHHISLEKAITNYFSRCATILSVKQQIRAEDWFDLHHEALIEGPQARLAELCQFLGQEAPSDYLRDAASIIYASPHQSRYDVSWPSALRHTVQQQIASYAYLHRYTYESD